MKSRFLLVLPLAGMLALPAIAQNNNQQSQSSNPPAATQQQPNDQASPAQTSSSDQARQPLTFERHEGFWGRINPFARKKYVQRQLTPIRDRMNELDELTAKNATAIKDVDSRATEGIRQADKQHEEHHQNEGGLNGDAAVFAAMAHVIAPARPPCCGPWMDTGFWGAVSPP